MAATAADDPGAVAIGSATVGPAVNDAVFVDVLAGGAGATVAGSFDAGTAVFPLDWSVVAAAFDSTLTAGMLSTKTGLTDALLLISPS